MGMLKLAFFTKINFHLIRYNSLEKIIEDEKIYKKSTN